MSAVYIVNAPDGQRLVHAGSKAAAINFAVRSTVTTKPVKSSELHQFLQKGMKIEEAINEQIDLLEDKPQKPRAIENKGEKQ